MRAKIHRLRAGNLRYQAIAMWTAAEGATAGQIADVAASTWRRVGVALSPIIGDTGVAALFKRCLYLARVDHPFLTAVYDATVEPGSYAALQTALSQQTVAAAAAAHGALLQTFQDLLTNLIGGSLTERLLRSVWDNPSSGLAVQDTLP